MSDTSSADAGPPEDEVEPRYRLLGRCGRIVKHHVNVASNVKLVKKALGAGFSGTASGFCRRACVCPEHGEDTRLKSAGHRVACETAINGRRGGGGLAKQADETLDRRIRRG